MVGQPGASGLLASRRRFTPACFARRPWTVDGTTEVGGYVTTYANNFSFATVRGSGHMVPLYRPRAAHELIASFVNNSPLPVYHGPLPSFQCGRHDTVGFAISRTLLIALSFLFGRGFGPQPAPTKMPRGANDAAAAKDALISDLQAEVARLRAKLAACQAV